jgi:hypothetical protein
MISKGAANGIAPRAQHGLDDTININAAPFS